MSILQGAAHVTITGGTHVAAGSGSTFHIHQADQERARTSQPLPSRSVGLSDLSAHTAHAALYNSSARFDAPRCHRNTRTSYLDRLERWMLGQLPRDDEYAFTRLIWLTGGVGAGKSAIMQSIVERTAQYSVVIGSFFFSRADPTRNYAETLIPTLAYQLACAFPSAMAILDPVIEQNPLIFSASLQTQAQELLVRPLLHLINTGVIDPTSRLRTVIVIDGLDECSGPKKQALIIHVIVNILHDFQIPVSFIIASRPELAISQAFHRESRVFQIVAPTNLDANEEAVADIRQYIEDSFLDIRDTHPLRGCIPKIWPTPDSVNTLVKKSSGHFIYAATAMKFISSGDEHPARALLVIEGLEKSRTGSPFAELDALYTHVISSVRYPTELLEILRHCMTGYFQNTVTSICFMYTQFSPDDIELYLSDVRALVSLGPDDKANMRVSLNHASLSEFLGDKQRSGPLYMDGGTYIAAFVSRYFDMLDIDANLARSLLMSSHIHTSDIVAGWGAAVKNCPDIDMIHSLINRHSLRQIWDLFFRCLRGEYPLEAESSIIDHLSNYLMEIRSSAANIDNALYIQQFNAFIQTLVDKSTLLGWQFRLVPALLFSSTPSCLNIEFPSLLGQYFFTRDLRLGHPCRRFFASLKPSRDHHTQVDPRSLDAIRRMPQRQSSWGGELASALGTILRNLAFCYLCVPEHLIFSPHKRWLRKAKPFKNKSLGSPKLASAFYLSLLNLPYPTSAYSQRVRTAAFGVRHRRYSPAWGIAERREKCYVLLKALAYYLHKSDCTSGLAKLARKSLPMAALVLPKLMRKARQAMDNYVLRWEASREGLLEKTQSMIINGMD